MVKGLIFDVALKNAYTEAILLLPFLGYPVISTVFSAALMWFGKRVYKALSAIVTFNVITIENAAHRKEYEKAVSDLQVIPDRGDLSGPELEKAKQAFKDTLSKLTRSRLATT